MVIPIFNMDISFDNVPAGVEARF